MSRFDKYEPRVGGFRAKLNAAIVSTDVGKIQGVSINGTGRVVVGGAAETAITGVICPVRPMDAGEVIDVMTSGEIVDATMTAGTAFAAGALVYAHLSGAVDSTATAGKAIAKMVEATRMIVRCPVATT